MDTTTDDTTTVAYVPPTEQEEAVAVQYFQAVTNDPSLLPTVPVSIPLPPTVWHPSDVLTNDPTTPPTGGNGPFANLPPSNPQGPAVQGSAATTNTPQKQTVNSTAPSGGPNAPATAPAGPTGLINGAGDTGSTGTTTPASSGAAPITGTTATTAAPVHSAHSGGISPDFSPPPPPQPTVQFNQTAYLTPEGEQTVLTASLSITTTQTVTVQYTTVAGTAQAGVDFTATSGTLTFLPGASNAYITVPGLDDNGTGESNENFSVTLSNATNATLGSANTATVSIYEDDDSPPPQPTLQFSQSSFTANEGSPINLPITLSTASSQTVSVQYATMSGTAQAGVDYTTTTGTLTFPANTTQEFITVPILDDNGTGESGENFNVSLSNPSNATLGTPSTAAVNIAEDNDTADTVSFANPSFTAPEGSSATIGVNLAQMSSQPVTVNYATSDGSAHAGTDYTSSSGTLTFAPNTTYTTFNVPLPDDNGTGESNETINLTLGNPSGAVITGPNPAVLNITEDAGQLSWSGMPSFTWTPMPTPPPTITNPGAQTSVEAAIISLPIQASDPNHYPLTYDAVDLPIGLSINASTGVISGTVDSQAAEDFGGSYQTTVIAADGHGGSSNQTFNWTITDTPRLPVFTSPGNQTSTNGATVTLQLNASQPDGDPLIYDASNLPPGLSIDSDSGAITGTIDPTAAIFNTPYSVTATATDAATNLVASQTFNWTVSAANQPPTLTSPGNQTNAAGDSVDVPLTASDPDGDALTFTATNLPAGLSIDPGSGEITGTIVNSAASATPYNVTILASDGSSSSSQTISWTVGYVGLSNPGDQSNVAGDVVSLPLAGYSATNATLTYGASNLPSGLSINTSTGVISGTLPASAAASNPYAVTVSASDGTNTINQTFNWTVARLALVNPGDQDNVEGSNVSLQLSATDVGGTPTYSASGLPSGVTINASTGLVSGTIGTAAHGSSPYQVTFTITDGTNSVSQPLVWTVTPRVALVNPGPQGSAAGDTVSVAITATDTQGATLMYSAMNLPPGVSVNPSTGVLSGTISANASSGSPYNVTVTASDNMSSSSQTFPWSVSPIYIPSPGAPTNLDGDNVSLSLAAHYHGMGTLSYSITGQPPGVNINSTTGVVSGTIAGTADTNSPYSVTVTATDGTTTTNQTFNWTINPLVSVDAVSDQTNAVSDAVSLQLTDTDALNNPVTWSATGLPPGVTMGGSSGLLTGTVSLGADSGNPYVVTATATDGAISSSQTFNWNITHVALANPGPQSSADDTSVSLTLRGHDADGGAVTFGASNLPPGVSLNPSTGVISGTLTATADAGGPYPVTVSATDGTFTTMQTFLWTVAQVGLSNPGNLTNTEGDTISLQLQGTTPSGTLTYSASNLPAGVNLNPTTGQLSGTIAAGDAANGPYTTIIVARNGTTNISQTFTWTVNPQVNVTALADQNNKEGDVVSLQVQASDVGHRTLTYSAVNLPAGVNINSTTGLISGTIAAGDAANGPYPVTVTATDGTYSTSQSFNWNITHTDTMTPTLTNPGSQANVAGDSVSLALAASDPDGDTLTFSATGLPDGLSVDPFGGVVSGVIASDAVSQTPYAVTVTATDGNGISANQTFSWFINDAALTAQGASLSATEGTDTGTVTVATFTSANVNSQAGDFTATVNWGDGNSDPGTISGSNGAFTVMDDHVYAEKGNYAVSVVIADNYGGTTTATGTATMTDAALSLTGGLQFGVLQQQSATVTLATLSDGNADANLLNDTVMLNWGDYSNPTQATLSLNTDGSVSVTGTHTYTQTGTYTVTMTSTDADGAMATATSTIVVGNTYAGVPTTLTLASITDSNPNAATTDLTVTVNWGDGNSGPGTVTKANGVFTVTATHNYAVDSFDQSGGVYQVTATITEEGGSTLTGSTAVTVVRPLETGAGNNLVASAGVPVNSIELATFTDPDASDTASEFTAQANWGDGTPLDSSVTVEGGNGLFHVYGSHTYAAAGQYGIQVTVQQHWSALSPGLVLIGTALVFDAIKPKVLGPTVVPGWSQYQYRLSTPSDVVSWSADAPLSRGLVGKIALSADKNTATLRFNNNAAYGKLSVKLKDGQTLLLPVSVVRVEVTTPAKAFTPAKKPSASPSDDSPWDYKIDGTKYPQKGLQEIRLASYDASMARPDPSLKWQATVKLVAPAGNPTAVSHITVGFVQHAEHTQDDIVYGKLPKTLYASVVSTTVHRLNFIDHGDNDPPSAWYATQPFIKGPKGLIPSLLKGKSDLISASDSPSTNFLAFFPSTPPSPGTEDHFHINFTLDVAAISTDQPGSYFMESTAPWTVDLSGTFKVVYNATKKRDELQWMQSPSAGVTPPTSWKGATAPSSAETITTMTANDATDPDKETWSTKKPT